jgi:transposase-like protein
VITAPGELLKMDTLGRARTSRERREAILDEFEQSGLSGAQFAKLAGIQYSTFAGWRHRRRQSKLGKRVAKTRSAASRQPALRLIEALVDPGRQATNQGPLLHLPGGARLELTTLAQVPLVAALLQALQPPAVPC